MGELGIPQLISLGSTAGVTVLVLILWHLSAKDLKALLTAYREDTKAIIARYDADMAAVRNMYSNNVKLVERITQVAEDLKETVVLNTTKWQQAWDAIMSNQFCPLSELRRKPRKGPE